MTRRKPPGVRFETWIERQIRQAEERGEFDDLPGRGRPLRGLDRSYDEMWWVKDKLRREGLSYLPPALALRKEVHDVLEGTGAARSEAEVRERIEAINEKIRDAIRTPQLRGPSIDVVPLNVERVVADWRARRAADGADARGRVQKLPPEGRKRTRPAAEQPEERPAAEQAEDRSRRRERPRRFAALHRWLND